MALDLRLSYDDHIKSALSKVNKTIGLLQKFQPALPRNSLIIVYKSFIRSYAAKWDQDQGPLSGIPPPP